MSNGGDVPSLCKNCSYGELGVLGSVSYEQCYNERNSCRNKQFSSSVLASLQSQKCFFFFSFKCLGFRMSINFKLVVPDNTVMNLFNSVLKYFFYSEVVVIMPTRILLNPQYISLVYDSGQYFWFSEYSNKTQNNYSH